MEIGDVEVGEVPIVCASVAEATPREMAAKATDTGADVVELRVDALDDPGAPEAEREMASLDVEEPAILTVRREGEGGDYRGSERSRAELIRGLMEHADAVDVELEAPERTRERVLDKASELNLPVVVSFHDFSESSSGEELLNAVERSLEMGDLAKAAVTPASLEDTLELLEVTLHAKDRFRAPISTLAMGEIGSHTRFVAPLYGSDLTYAAADEPVAPGQLSVEETMEGLRLLGLR